MCYRKNGRPAHIVMLCFALILLLCVGSVAYGEGFNAVLKKAARAVASPKHDEDFNFSSLMERAERGDAEAQFLLGVMYARGHGVGQDYKEARKWWEKAVAQNYVPAFNELGLMYAQGHGVKQNYKKARELFEKAAAKNYPRALSNLGFMYSEGYGVRQDYRKAREYYEKAAALNYAPAFKDLAFMYAQGHGVRQDYNKAREYYEKAAAQNDANALYNLGIMYEEGRGVRQDYRKALEYYEKAVDLNYFYALNNLAVMYAQGHGVKQNYNKARELFEKAAALNDAHALYNLGFMYEEGHGVRRDYNKAREYYEKAAAQNYAHALNNLGRMYEEGRGVKQDYKKALEYYIKGAGNGNIYAMTNLARIYENGLGTKKDMKKALDFYRKASAEGSAQARKALIRLKAPEDKNASVATKTQKHASSPSSNNSRSILADNALIKPRVAVIAFDDKSEEKNAPASAIMNMMISELHKTGAFELLEREHLDAVMNERNLLSMSDPSTAAKLGRIAGAQYIITGAITLYYYSEKGSGFLLPILGAATQAKTAYVVIDARIIDVETGKIVYASDQTGDATNKAKTSIANYNKMVGGLLGMATRNAVEKHVSAMKSLTLEI
ncbi:MAG: SEL1-like repeat protein [Synergistaceae bacterium]|nr:SEL1-like repeat protein [Synergistaceae bacterium]